MAGAALQRRLIWRLGEVRELVDETPRVRSLVLDVPGWPGHLAGQHIDVRLTADDGYQAERSYSISSAPAGNEHVELTVERLDDGEVSPYLTGELQVGDKLELRGPIGGHFVWDVGLGGPLLLVGGGSGVAPLMAMLRHRKAAHSTVQTRLLYSARSIDDVIYRAELDRLGADGDGLQVRLTLTRVQPQGWSGLRRRIDAEMLSEIGWPPEAKPMMFICGPTPLVESAAEALVKRGHDPMRIKTERFGPTGG
jgi:ferredoxin-NADP reductase